ncbi:6-phosphogluconate dehydrogenase [Aestuariibaculum sediminum]|uniref:6-phosphogluconate dehydrogenase n=1 Tax=Aestuariibaculum sediminum TaxID=2770637 RepID=A0A8J6PZJ9_9FLAO|nr:6-phosphogluconate dehydrogenase [Aestuariibaculum sediminum]MBD0832298.1 6-phosphogluconate dehydrogenase [Aestuariibaculum sediminum]
MKRFLYKLIAAIVIVTIGYFCFVYYVPYSEGVRSGDLIKFSKKGVLTKTWEGELSQGVSEEQRFSFSVEKNDQKIINDLQKYQGRFVRLSYIERYRTFFWLGDTKYFITKVEEDKERQSFQHSK